MTEMREQESAIISVQLPDLLPIPWKIFTLKKNNTVTRDQEASKLAHQQYFLIPKGPKWFDP